MKLTIDIDDKKITDMVINYLQDSINTHIEVHPDKETIFCLLGTLEYMMPYREYQDYIKSLDQKLF